MTHLIHPTARTSTRLLQAAVLVVTTSLAAAVAAAPIDLSVFNALQVRFRAGDLVWQDTHSDGSKTTSRADASTWDSSDGDFKRGRFDGNEYKANWNQEITLSSGKWKLNGSASITLSSTSPPTVTAFRIEEFSDYPGSQHFGPSKAHYLISGPPAGTVLPFEESDPTTLVFGVTNVASCTAFATLTIVYEYPQPGTDGIVRSELINRSASSCTSSVEEYFDIDFWALPPVTPVPTQTPSMTASLTVTSTPTRTPTPSRTPTITPPAFCGEPGLRTAGEMGAAAVPYCPEIVDIDFVQAIGLRQRVEHWKDGQPDKAFALGNLNPTDQLLLVTRSSDKPGKATWVRVYATNPDPDPNAKPIAATLTLRGSRDGLNLGRLQEQTKDLRSGAKVDRESPNSSYTVFDFKLPPEWRHGDLDVTAEFVQPQQGLPRTESLYVSPRKLRIGYVLFDDTTAQDKVLAKGAAWLMQLMYPAAVEYFQYSPLLQKVARTTEARQIHLASLLNQDAGHSADILIGWTKGLTTGDPGGGRAYRGRADGPWLCDSGLNADQPCVPSEVGSCPPDPNKPSEHPICAQRISSTGVRAMVAPMPATAGWAAEILAHEIGHLFLLEHPHATDGGGLGLGTYHAFEPWGCNGCPGPKKVWDDTVRPLHRVPPPYIETCLIQELKSRSRGLQNGTGRTDFEFMWQSTGLSSKWAPANRKSHNVWISQASWEWLFDRISELTSARAERGQTAVTIPSLLLRGLVAEDGSSAVFDPALPAAGPDSTRADGTYCLELQDANGATWERQCFEPTEPGDDGEIGPSPFTEAVMLTPDLARVRLYHGTALLAEQRVSAHAPTLQITAPAAGATLTGVTTLHWAGTDLDGDALSYLVEYSTDNRQSWTALAVDEVASALELDTSALAGGNAWLRVVATDGLNFAANDVGPLHVPTKAPEIVITSPQPDAVFHEGAAVTFIATGYDPEDGGTPTEAFKWNSDRDGPIDTDAIVTTRALSVGRHLITVNAADDDGNVGSASVSISIVPFCLGDCSVDRKVAVDELVTGVNIALGTGLLDDCAPFDGNDDGRVTVDELVQAVNAALNGCP